MERKPYIPNLAGDLAECDANYLRLRRLFPAMGRQDSFAFGFRSRTGAEAQVTLAVHERSPFTTTLLLTVSCAAGKPFIRWPRLKVRIYHDVKSAEVVQFDRHRNFHQRYPVPNPQLFAPDEKSQVNRFLGELLAHCLAQGHSLEPLAFS